MKAAGLLLAVLAIVGGLAMSAEAYTVAGYGKGGFADFSKAIVFTSSACPSNAETIVGSTATRNCAIPMAPVGDGSWVCTAVMFPGTSYTYYFEYRIPIFDSTTRYTDSNKTYVWRNVGATGNRAQDASRDVTAPSNASQGYIFYNIFGDKTVMGGQGIARTGSWDTELTVENPMVARYQGATKVSTSGDADTTNMEGANAFGIAITQMADTTVRITWNMSIGDGFVPTLEGAKEFDTQSAQTPYGFKILRARVQNTGGTYSIHQYLRFEDTVVQQVRGDSYYSPHRTTLGQSWYNEAQYFTDTSLPANTAVGDSFVYTVLWTDAYGLYNDTADQNFGDGSDQFTRGAAVEMLFLVEHFDMEKVFPNGATEGTMYLTPYVNGIPNPFKKIKTRAFLYAPRVGFGS